MVGRVTTKSTASKIGPKEEVYSVLLVDDHQTTNQPAEELMAAAENDDVKKELGSSGQRLQVQFNDLAIKRDDHSRPLKNCFITSLLLIVGATYAIAFVFHLWLTFHLQGKVIALQGKVIALQAQVDSLSALDLEELFGQLRELYGMHDLNDHDQLGNNDGFPGVRIKADEAQEDGYEKAVQLDFDKGEENMIEITPPAVEMAKLMKGGNAYSEKDEESIYDDSAVDNADDVTHLEKKKRRQKRQADLSSHTQEGIPIFDRGYGISLNRTEGLRIYQSLLAGRSGGDSSTSDNNRQPVTDTPILPHHRQNSFWNEHSNRREGNNNRRHQHHHHQHPRRPNTYPTGGSDLESTATESNFVVASNEQYPVRSTLSPRQYANVEFRHSRVKPSETSSRYSPTSATHSPSTVTVPLSRDQKLWSVSHGDSPSSSSSSEDDRINAATSPAVLTQTVTLPSHTSSSAPGSRARGPNVFKVTQPAIGISQTSSSRSPLQPHRATGDNELAPSRPFAGSANGGNNSGNLRRRMNKKQLRDLSHIATAVHLVADARNDSSALADQAEIASRNELGLHTSWRVSSSSWDSQLKMPGLVKIDGSTLTIKQSGLYFIYSQVHYLDGHSTNAYEVFVNTEPFLRCVTSTFASDSSSVPRANTCYTAGATYLREGDKLFLRDIEPLRYSVLQPSKTFFGLVRMAPIADYS